MQHATARMFIAEKGKGAYILHGGKKQKIATSTQRRLSQGVRIYIDEYFEYNRKTFSPFLSEFEPKYECASSLYYAALAEGEADVVLECTRKGNLEFAVEYGLTKEAGGVVVDLMGQDIGEYAYLQFGQQEYEGVISAANKELALVVLKKIGC